MDPHLRILIVFLIHSIYHGDGSFFIQFSKNELHVMGDNRWSAIGFNEHQFDNIDQFTPLSLPSDNDDEISFMSNTLAAHHSILVTKKKKFYCWGMNTDYQLGDIRS